VSQVSGQFRASQAQLERARAAEASARLNLERTEGLRKESIASQAELDQMRNAMRIASADVLAQNAQVEGLAAQLQSANTTLAYTKIYSPIDGIVIDRAVDPGQTVASSFSAPVLFVIAQDLSAMQVLADIDEADVGKLREGMAAQIRVDAFPERTFAGTVTQIRYSPTEVLGVVTYAAVIDVRNDELALRPGMTATVTVTAESVQGAKAVRNSALRFKPKAPEALGGAPEPAPGQRRVFVLDESAPPADGKPAEPKLSPRVVRVGISDGVWTELRDDTLAPGTRVVTEERSSPESERRKFLGIF
jgi:HlyD family secretion protein